MTHRRAFSVAIFARHHDHVLLIEHRRLQTWLPVGGEIEPGETPLEAARRELREETGLEGSFTLLPDAIDGAPPGLLGYEEHQAGSKGLHLNFAFVADVATREVVPNDEIVSFRWVPDASGVDCPPNVRQLVELALQPSLDTLVRRWIDAYNARDLNAVLVLYTEGATHTSPKLRERQPHTRGEIRGQAALRAWWQDAMQRLPDLHYELHALTTTGDRAVLEYVRHNPGEAPMPVAQVFVRRGGKLASSHVFHG